MAKSGALSTSNQYVKYTIEIIQNSQSIPNNTSNVTVKVRFYRTNTGYETYGSGTVYCKINGTTYSASVDSNDKITNSGIVLFTKTLNISHGADGKKTLTCSAWINIDAPLTSSEQSYSLALTAIPRYAKITTFTVTAWNETSVKVTWGCDVSCDKIYYSLNGGSFVETSGYPSFMIQGLKANTSYSIKIRVRRTDSQLTTDSSAISKTTYNYPHCNSAPDFTLGNRCELGVYNPLGRTYTLKMLGADGSTVYSGEHSGTSVSGFYADAILNKLYASIPNAQSGTYKVQVVYGSNTNTKTGGKYTVKGTETPTVGTLSYADVQPGTLSVTGNNQLIVQNLSILQITYGKATPTYSAGSIKKYTFELNGVTKESTTQGGTVNFGNVNSSSDLKLTMTVTDSRGLTAKKTLNIAMAAYNEPTASVVLERLNNYEDETYLTVNASIAGVDGKNTASVQYRYKQLTGEYTQFITIPNKQTQVLSLDKRSTFIFDVKVTDAFGFEFLGMYTLYKGVFPLFIDTEKNAVGINEFPAEGEALRVAGGVAHFDDGVKIANEMIQDFVIEQGTSGKWTYRKWHSGNVDMECVISNTSATANALVEVSVDLPFEVSQIIPYVSCLAGGWALTKPPYFNVYGGNNAYNNVAELKLYYTAENATSRAYYFAIQVKGTFMREL